MTLDAPTCRALIHLQAEAADQLALHLWNKFQAAPTARFIADVDEVNERLAALDRTIARMEADRG